MDLKEYEDSLQKYQIVLHTDGHPSTSDLKCKLTKLFKTIQSNFSQYHGVYMVATQILLLLIWLELRRRK